MVLQTGKSLPDHSCACLTIDSWTNESGFGCHTFKWVNANGKFVYIKYHFLPKGGSKQLTRQEANRLGGEDPDYSKKELWNKIENGTHPEWTAYVQVMDPEEADPAKLGFDPFDVTKVWPRKQFPMQEFGKVESPRRDSVKHH
jgi:catalase